MILSKDLDIAGVCKVFQNINTTGLRLSAFDICVATFMPHGINIKSKLLEAKKNRPTIKAILDEDETIILQTIALIADVWPKKNNLPDNLKPYHIIAHWENAEKCLELCAKIFDSIGVGISKGVNLLPYQPLVPIVAAALYTSNYMTLNHAQKAAVSQKIKKWFYHVCLELRFTEGTDNKMKEDHEQLVKWFMADEVPNYIKSGVLWNPAKAVTANKNGAFGKAILTAINSNLPSDFYTDQNVGFGPSILADCQLHHIFPDAKYKTSPSINSVFNFTFITTESNQFIKDKRTNEYPANIISETGITIDQLKGKFLGHFIDDKCYSFMQSQSLDDFIMARANCIYQFLKDTVGITISISSQQSEEQDIDIDDNFEEDDDLN